MGGIGSAGTFNDTNDFGVNSKGTFIFINPNIGYFILDKFAIGLTGQISTRTNIIPGYQLGTFAKYYFLKDDRVINIFSEISYNSVFSEADYVYNTIKLKTGTAIFLNNSVALEVSINYYKGNSKLAGNNASNVYLGVGFQIHLEKE